MNFVTLDLASIDKELQKTLKPLIPDAKFHCYLKNSNPFAASQASLLAVAAFEHEKPIGLVLGYFLPFLNYSEIDSLFVLENDKHVAEMLIRQLEVEVKKKKGVVISCKYESDRPDLEAFETLLKDLQWAKPKNLILHCHFYVQKFNPHWLNTPYALPKGISIFPWQELTKKEERELKKEEEEGIFPVEVSPFSDNHIEPLNSLGLRYQDQVIGWMITHRLDEETIRYAFFYINPSYRHTIAPFALLTRSILLQKSSSIPKSVLNLNLELTTRLWDNFVKKRLIPETYQTTYTKLAWHDLTLHSI